MIRLKNVLPNLWLAVALILTAFAPPSKECKTWDATDKAKKFVKQTIVIGFFASPYGAGWTKDEHLHDYLGRSQSTGITGHGMTLAAAGCGELVKFLPPITDELWKRGYSNEDITKIYGGNKMRVYNQVW